MTTDYLSMTLRELQDLEMLTLMSEHGHDGRELKLSTINAAQRVVTAKARYDAALAEYNVLATPAAPTRAEAGDVFGDNISAMLVHGFKIGDRVTHSLINKSGVIVEWRTKRGIAEKHEVNRFTPDLYMLVKADDGALHGWGFADVKHYLTSEQQAWVDMANASVSAQEHTSEMSAEQPPAADTATAQGGDDKPFEMTVMQKRLMSTMYDGHYIYRNGLHTFMWFSDGGNAYSDTLVVRPLIERNYLYEEACEDGIRWQATISDGAPPAKQTKWFVEHRKGRVDEWHVANGNECLCGKSSGGMKPKQKRPDSAVVCYSCWKKVDPRVDAPADPAPSAAPVKATGVRLSKAQRVIAERLNAGWKISAHTEYYMTTWVMPDGTRTPDACNIASLHSMRKNGAVAYNYQDKQWQLTPDGKAALALAAR